MVVGKEVATMAAMGVAAAVGTTVRAARVSVKVVMVTVSMEGQRGVAREAAKEMVRAEGLREVARMVAAQAHRREEAQEVAMEVVVVVVKVEGARAGKVRVAVSTAADRKVVRAARAAMEGMGVAWVARGAEEGRVAVGGAASWVALGVGLAQPVCRRRMRSTG